MTYHCLKEKTFNSYDRHEFYQFVRTFFCVFIDFFSGNVFINSFKNFWYLFSRVIPSIVLRNRNVLVFWINNLEFSAKSVQKERIMY
jgi:hypothetical protein